jgi:hypothetical protein
MHKIVDVKPLSGYRVWIHFDDGEEGEVDLSDLVGQGVFELWNDPEEFLKVTIDLETHTLTWRGGIDLCPDTLYQDVLSLKAAANK